jgi:hypothetical protein
MSYRAEIRSADGQAVPKAQLLHRDALGRSQSMSRDGRAVAHRRDAQRRGRLRRQWMGISRGQFAMASA